MLSENAIEITHLCKQYKKILAVNDLNLDIKKGEIFALLGHNGAGKTTVIKILSCLLRETSGQVKIMGYDLKSNISHIKGLFNISPQETAVAPNLTVLENLELISRLYGEDKENARIKAKEILNSFDLIDRADDRAKTLSGGMQRKLSIAMALITDPEIIFLDEPTLGLDPQARRELWNQIIKLKGKKTVLLTTHYLEEADYLADSIGIMKHGNLVVRGSSLELKNKYFSSKTIIIKCITTNEELIKDLHVLYPDCKIIPEGIVITTKDIDYNKVFLCFNKHNVAIESINNKEVTLDDVYLAINGGER